MKVYARKLLFSGQVCAAAMFFGGMFLAMSGSKWAGGFFVLVAGWHAIYVCGADIDRINRRRDGQADDRND